MEKKNVDARGELCPKPLIMTKKALKGFNGELIVLLDNETAYENVQRFLSDNGKAFSADERNGEYTIRVNSDGSPAENTAAEDYCPVPVSSSAAVVQKAAPYVIAFSSDRMGTGDDDLGKILIQGFCNTIKEADPLPGSLVFYNSGVKLAIEGSPVLSALKALEEDGIKLLVCGTCADYFDVKDKVGAGIISNMYDILDCLTTAGHVVKP